MEQYPKAYIRICFAAASVLAFCYGIYESLRIRWLSDDAFISFRYARNLIRGNGLVFNPGEYVEGFTNLLWTLLMAPGMYLGLEPGILSMALSILCYAGLLIYAVVFVSDRGQSGRTPPDYGRKSKKASTGSGLATGYGSLSSLAFPTSLTGIPLLLGLAGMHHMHVFATSGLETMAFSLAVFTGLHSFFARKAYRSGVGLLTLSCFLRPDGLIFLALCYLWLIVEWLPGWKLDAQETFRENRKSRNGPGPADNGLQMLRQNQGMILLPVLVLMVYEIWRIVYYQSLFPNTFYAKSAYSPYANQGWIYLKLFYQSYWYIPLLFLASLVAIYRLRRLPAGWMGLASAALLWHVYVLWVGGDFMFARFLIPVVPVLFYLILSPISGLVLSRYAGSHETSADETSADDASDDDASDDDASADDASDDDASADEGSTAFRGTPALLFLLVLICLPLLRMDLYRNLRRDGKAPEIQGVVEERFYYPRKRMEELALIARSYGAVVRQSGVRMAFHGGAAFLVYHMDPVYALEASTGLTDATLARTILSERGRIGHEKQATLEYMKEKNIHIYMWPPSTEQKSREIEFQGFWQPWQIVLYDARVFKVLDSHPGIRFEPPLHP